MGCAPPFCPRLTLSLTLSHRGRGDCGGLPLPREGIGAAWASSVQREVCGGLATSVESEGIDFSLCLTRPLYAQQRGDVCLHFRVVY